MLFFNGDCIVSIISKKKKKVETFLTMMKCSIPLFYFYLK